MRLRRRRDLGSTFGRLFIASTVSNVGDGALLAALPLLARNITRDPVAISAVTVAATLPWLLFALPAGAFVDRIDRLEILIRSNVARAGVLAAFTLLVAFGKASVAWIIATVFVLGLAETVCDTAAGAWLPAVVPAEDLETANGRLFAAQVAANTMVGPSVGAGLFGVVPLLPFAVNAGAFGFSARLLASARTEHSPGPPVRRASMGREIREGLAWVWGERGVRAFAIGAAGVNLAHTGAIAVTVLLLRDELGMSPFGYGLTLTGAAVGGIVGAQTSAAIVAAVGRKAAALGSVALFSLSLLGAGLAANAVLVAVALAVFGAAGEVWNVVAVSYRQARVPSHLLGRVMATYRFVAYGAMPAGAALGGIVAKHAGVRATFVCGGLVIAGLLAYLGPTLHRALQPEAVVTAA